MSRALLFVLAIAFVATVSAAPSEKKCAPWLGFVRIYRVFASVTKRLH